LFFDDDISTEEMNLICGVYRVYTGSGQQAADVSWWPKQSMWNSGGLNVGYWSPDCETWFQSHLALICSNSAPLRSAAQWK
ncbi:hypothetical protein K439DRAFT_1282344, partial [Ramaria rubella]